MEERRIRGDLIQQYKINTSFDKVNWYKPNITIPSQKFYDTRSHPYSMTKQLVKNCAIRSNFFTNRIVNNWNQQSQNVIEAPTINKFKNRIDKCFKLKDFVNG